MSSGIIHCRALITVKTYPEPSSKYRETVCTAAIREDHRWIRLYPIWFRDLPRGKRFEKYQIVELDVVKHDRDPRPESYRPDLETLRLGPAIGPGKRWGARKDWVIPTLSPSMCAIRRLQRTAGKSLGAFRPKEILEFEIEKDTADWAGKRKARKNQRWFADLEKPLRLEKIPFRFYYRYRCDDPGCPGHKQSILDWEISELYRKVRDRAGDDEALIKAKIRQKYWDEICAPARDTIFFVGNLSARPSQFCIIGVFWPPKSAPELF